MERLVFPLYFITRLSLRETWATLSQSDFAKVLFLLIPEQIGHVITLSLLVTRCRHRPQHQPRSQSNLGILSFWCWGPPDWKEFFAPTGSLTLPPTLISESVVFFQPPLKLFARRALAGHWISRFVLFLGKVMKVVLTLSAHIKFPPTRLVQICVSVDGKDPLFFPPLLPPSLGLGTEAVTGVPNEDSTALFDPNSPLGQLRLWSFDRKWLFAPWLIPSTETSSAMPVKLDLSWGAVLVL